VIPRRLFSLVALTATLAVLAGVAADPNMAATRPPVTSFQDATFGRVLADRKGQALYYWNREPKGTIRCVGECLEAWPALIVRSAKAVPRKIAGLKGTFGVIKRPDGRLQVTHNRRAIYTYAHEGPRQVLCNDVDGWFVVRA
jgi:predicted lipoprotein with Yx(FWY)xxD motif